MLGLSFDVPQTGCFKTVETDSWQPWRLESKMQVCIELVSSESLSSWLLDDSALGLHLLALHACVSPVTEGEGSLM